MTLVRNDRKRHEVEESGVIGGGNDRKGRKRPGAEVTVAAMTLGRNDRKRQEVEEAGVTGGGTDRKLQEGQEQEERWQR